MGERTKYEIKGIKGIDDLLSLYAFSFNDGGGGSYSNDIEWYKNSKGWVHFDFDCEMTDEAIAKEIERRKNANRAYLDELMRTGEFGKKYITTIELEYNPLYDGKQKWPQGPLQSYRMVFLDFSNNNNDKPESETKE